MKKLKKVLSLVLVLAMALSVFGVCASAANVEDYADADEITYTEAVGVLSGLGVLKGDENGFRPTDTLNRAEAAKIASYLIGLQDEVVQGPSFSDVAEDNWARGFIAICESQELVHGNGDGTYTPDGTLTGYEWEKIVLCALGYDATIEKMVGDSWQGGVANLAKKTGLLKGLEDDYKAANEITREQAAQIAFNALKTKTVVYPHTTDKIAGFGDKTLGELIFNLGTDVTYDIFGAPVADTFINTKTGDVYAEFSYEAIASYTNVAGGTKYAEIVDDIKDDAKGAAKITVYVDGEAVSVDKSDKLGGLGVQVDTYKLTTDGSYRVIVKNTYVKEIAKTDITDAKSNTNGTVTTPSEVINLKNDAYLETGDLKADDIIIYNVGNTGNTDKGKTDKVVAANVEVKTPYGGYATTVSFNGTVATLAAKAGYIAFDKGENIYFDANAEAKAGTVTLLINNYYGYVFDNYGNIIYIYKATPAPVSDKGHLYVIATISYYTDGLTQNTSALWQPILNPEAAAQALVIEYTDDTAEVKVVDLAIAETKDNKFAYVNKYGEIGAPVSIDEIDENYRYAFVEYYVTSDGKYILDTCDKAIDNLTTTEKTEVVDIKNNNTDSKGLATTSTKLTYLTATIDPYTVVTKGNIYDIASSIEVSAKTVTGYTNFITASTTNNNHVNGAKSAYLYYAGTKITEGAMIVKANVKDTIQYAMFTGNVEKNTDNGFVYSFLGSDGKTVEYSTTPADQTDEVVNGLNGTPVTGATDKTTFTEGTVYKLAINSEGKIVGYKDISIKAFGTATAVDYNNYGYLKVTTPTTVGTYYFNSSFKGYAYDVATEAAKDVNSLVTPTKREYVAIYTDSFMVGGNSEDQIVFVKAGQTEQTYEFTATLNKGSYGDYYFHAVDTTPADTLAAVTDPTTGVGDITALDATKNIYIGEFIGNIYKANGEDKFDISTQKFAAGDALEVYAANAAEFTVSIKVTTYVDGKKAYTPVKAVATYDWSTVTGKIHSIAADGDTTYKLIVNVTPQNGANDYPTFTGIAGDIKYTNKNSQVAGLSVKMNNGNPLKAGDEITVTVKTDKDGVETVTAIKGVSV
jgi:hypothetical protein